MPRLQITNIQGLIPLIDPTRIPDPHIIDGQNFYLDADGPISGFSRKIVASDLFTNADGIQALRVDEDAETYYFTRDGIYEWDSITRSLFARYIFNPILQDDFPWTFAVCGGKEYYARKGVGYLERDPQTGVWQLPPSVPNADKIVAVTQAGGRLIAITTQTNAVQWTSIDDGLDFTPSLETGAGFQSLAPLALTNLDTQLLTVLEYELGFIVYTTRGLMRFELIDAAIPFRFKVLTRQLAPINPWVVVQMGDYEHVFLDIRGFYRTRGQEPEPWQPLFSEYLHDKVLPNLDLTLRQILRMTSERDRDWVVLSLADATRQTLYNRAWVLYRPSDQWGSFNRPHKALIPVHKDMGAGFFDFGYIDGNDSLWEFSDTAVDELIPNARNGLFIIDWREPIEWPARRSTTNQAVFTAIAKMTADDVTRFTSAAFWNSRRVMEATPLIEVGAIDVPVDTVTSTFAVEIADIFGSGGLFGFRISGPTAGSITPSTWKETAFFQFAAAPDPGTDVVQLQFGPAPGTEKVPGIDFVIVAFDETDAPPPVLFFWIGGGTNAYGELNAPLAAYMRDQLGATVSLTLTPNPKFVANGRAEARIRRIRTALAEVEEGPLSSYIDIGVFRGGFDLDVDELSLLHEVSVGALAAGARDVFEDYIADFTEDFLIDWITIADFTADEDWGFGASDYSRFVPIVRGTLDGQTKWRDQEMTPEVQLAEGGYTLYSANVTGLHHVVRITALDAGDTFHVKTLELGIEPAGRLT